jgi:hypothetical protein
VNVVAGVDEFALLAVDVADRGLRGDDSFKPSLGDVCFTRHMRFSFLSVATDARALPELFVSDVRHERIGYGRKGVNERAILDCINSVLMLMSSPKIAPQAIQHTNEAHNEV